MNKKLVLLTEVLNLIKIPNFTGDTIETKLFDHQIDIASLFNLSELTVVKGPRGVGKTTILIYIALSLIINNSVKICIASQNSQLSVITAEIFKSIYDLNSVILPQITVNTLKTMTFENGSSIRFVNSNAKSTRGVNVDILMIDDAADFSDDSIKSLLPCRTAKGKSLLISTPRARSENYTFFETVYRTVESGLYANAKCYSIPALTSPDLAHNLSKAEFTGEFC